MRNHPPVAYRRWQATLILTLFFFSVAGAAGIGWWYARESPPHQGPIVVITVDGLPVSALSAYGAPASEMPAIAALAADAVVFDRAYASPETLPASRPSDRTLPRARRPRHADCHDTRREDAG